MKSGVFRKYFISISATFLICFTAMIIIITVVFSDFFTRDKLRTISESCESVASVATIDINSNDYERNIYLLTASLGNVSDVDIFITDADGVVYLCSCEGSSKNKKCIHTGVIVPKEILDSTFKREFKEVGNFNGIFEQNYYCAGSVIYAGGYEVRGYVYACASTVSLRAFTKRLTRLYIVSALFPIIIMFFWMFRATYKFTKPLKMMSEAAKKMSLGDFSQKIPVLTNDEIGELSNSFNQMTDALARLESTRRSFVANVSHEFKTPMTSIGGFIDGILDGTIPYEKQNYYLGIVSDEVKRLTRLVQSMLSLSKLESSEVSLNRAYYDFREQVYSIVVGQEQRVSDKNIQLRGLEQIPAIEIYADKDLMHQAIYNLVDNAIKFTNENGFIDFYATVENNVLDISIRNTGKGISESDLPLVFDRFYKTDKSRSFDKNGVGLGLYLVKTIIQLHSGNITVAGKENEFTKFEFTLPVNPELPQNGG